MKKFVIVAGGVDWVRTESASSQLGVAEAGGVDWVRTESASSQLLVTSISTMGFLNTAAASRGVHCGPPQRCSCFLEIANDQSQDLHSHSCFKKIILTVALAGASDHTPGMAAGAASYVRLMVAAPSPPPWDGSVRLTSLQSAQRRLLLAAALAKPADPWPLDLVETIAALIHGVPSGLNGILTIANALRYKSIFVRAMHPGNVLAGGTGRWYRECGRWHETRSRKPKIQKCEDVPVKLRMYSALSASEQVHRLHALIADEYSRRSLARACYNASMDVGTFRAIMQVVETECDPGRL